MNESATQPGSRASLDRALASSSERLLTFGHRVEAALDLALRSLMQGDRELAASVVAEDSELNELRFEVERICTEAIATQQPAASDLRAIVAAMNMVVDLERMGDHAAGIAKTVMQFDEAGPPEIPLELMQMADSVQGMLKEALVGYARRDPSMAYNVALQDDMIDQQYQALVRQLLERMAQAPALADQLLYLLFAGHNLERIADRVTNLSERVIFMVSGQMQELNPETDEARIS